MKVYDAVINQVKGAQVGSELSVEVVSKSLANGAFKNVPERRIKADVIAAFRKAEHEGFGKFVRGVKGNPSRFRREELRLVNNTPKMFQATFGLDNVTLGKIEIAANLTVEQRQHLLQQLQGMLRIS